MSVATDCPINGCTRSRSSAHAMCRTCWALVPAPLQSAVYRAYRARGKPGGLAEHLQAIENARAAVERRPAEDLFG